MSAIPADLPKPRRSVASSRLPDDSPLDRDPTGHIEIVTTRGQKRARPRLLVAVMTVTGLFAILAAQLLLTIATSEGAYEISALEAKETDLARDEQVLVEQMQVLDAPQHLAAEAQVMGMVPSSSAAYLRLADGAILGTATVASSSATLRTADDGTALIPDALLADVPLVGLTPPAEQGTAGDGSVPVDGTATIDGIVPADGAGADSAAVDGAAVDGAGVTAGAPEPADGTAPIASTPPAGIPSPITH